MAGYPMKSFIYIRLEKDSLIKFNVPLLQTIKSQFPDLYTIDIDNFSDSTLWQSIQEIIQLSEKSLIFFKVGSTEASLFSVIPFVESLLDLEDKIQLIVEGEHPVLSQLLNPLSNVRCDYVNETMLFQKMKEL
jgi:hypothetical protein